MPTLPATRPLIHGHRGCRGLFPENTVPAFLHALALGVDALELDVVISADNQVVVSHEPWLGAHLGSSPAGLPISTDSEHAYNLYHLPYADIRQCRVGVLPQPHFPQQQLVPTYRPLLREVLLATEAACQQLGRPPVNYAIEIKSAPATEGVYHPAPAAFIDLVLSACSPAILARTTLLSFDPRVLQAARHLHPHVVVCLLTETSFTPATVFEELGFVPEVFGPDYQLLTRETTHALKQQYPGLRVICWTLNAVADLIEIANWGVAGITTDYPDRAKQLIVY